MACPFHTSHISVHHHGKTVNAKKLNLCYTKEEPKEFYSVTLKLPLKPLCGLIVTKRKMATRQQQAQVVVWYAETNSFIIVQQNY